MQKEFQKTYADLNTRQREAVDTIDGPLMVIAGPGTGKTQLLSTRAANIVKQGNVSAQNILCLTYTETGASEMRSRLGQIMGVTGGDVAVHTFHGFGSWVINQYPEQFSTERVLTPLDDMGRYEIISGLLSKLPFRHQLAVRDENERFIRQHAVQEAIQAFKRAGLTPEELPAILKQNQADYTAFEPLLEEMFSSTLSAKRLNAIQAAVNSAAPRLSAEYGQILLTSLQAAIDDSLAAGKTAALGKWRTDYTTVQQGKRVLKSAATTELLHDTITLYAQYQAELQARGRYDYEDMVLWAARALEANQDMRFDVAERYQYVMVDEYQDTNGAQNRLLDALLSANPLDQPNVMTVGDDDQAIMRFQGAESSGMLGFIRRYQPKIIVLTDNYRSSQEILDATRQVMIQTDERLEVAVTDQSFTKQLIAQADRPQQEISHALYSSPTAEYSRITDQIKQLLVQGVPAKEIAVIGRKHAELAQFVPQLLQAGITVNYDRRENILEVPLIKDLLRLARLVMELADNPKRAENLLPTVLGAPYWQIDTIELYRLAASARQNKTGWLDTMLASNEEGQEQWQAIAEWLLAIARLVPTQNFTQMFDLLLGRAEVQATTLKFSPLGSAVQTLPDEAKLLLLSQLIKLREVVLAARPTATGLHDLLEVTDSYRLSGIQIVDSNPLAQGDSESVHVMTAHGAKGREFQHVFILSLVDEAWGNRARSSHNRIRLPENLPLYPAGDAISDRLRLLYVAMTRAKSHLHLTSYAENDNGKAATPLSYLQLGDAQWAQPHEQTLTTRERLIAVETSWQAQDNTRRDLQAVLSPAFKNFRMNASALRSFLDIRYAGPEACIEQHVLRFPSAYNAHSALGTAVHKTLQVAFTAYKDDRPLSTTESLAIFDEFLEATGLLDAELDPIKAYAHNFLPSFMEHYKSQWAVITDAELALRAEAPNTKLPLSGSLDAIANTKNGLTIIDYKTGSPPKPNWETKGLSNNKKLSLHFYRQQLLFYKILVDNASSMQDQVSKAELIFVEPDTEGEFIQLDITDFDPYELASTEQLIAKVYGCIMNGKLPDITGYSKDLKGVQQFEKDLLV